VEKLSPSSLSFISGTTQRTPITFRTGVLQ